LRFPPVVLFTDGERYWVGDGFHRILAASRAGLKQIAAHVRLGTHRDAILFGISANNDHGLPRTHADKRKAVELLLGDEEWRQWSDREIARRCGVGNWLVSRLRRSASVCNTQIARKVERGGTVYEMKKTKPVPTPEPAPVAAEPTAAPATAPEPGKPCLDRVGIPAPESRVAIFSAASDFAEAERLYDRLVAVLDRIAQSPAGTVYRQEMLPRTSPEGKVTFNCAALRTSRTKLECSEPFCAYCPTCHPTHPAQPYRSCKTCGGRGWTTRAAYEVCSSDSRKEILKIAGACKA
jgi:hypothetical protein